MAAKDDDGATILHFVGEYNRLTKKGKPLVVFVGLAAWAGCARGALTRQGR